MLSRQLKTVTLRAAASSRSTVAVTSPAVRTYAQAAPAAAGQDAKPPVALYGLDGTYASALVRSFEISMVKYDVCVHGGLTTTYLVHRGCQNIRS